MNIGIQNPIPCRVIPSYVYNGDTTKNRDRGGQPVYLSGEIVGVSTYRNQPVTFHAMIEKQWLYCDLPVTALVSREGKIEARGYTLRDRSIHLCEDTTAEVFTFAPRVGKIVAMIIAGDWHLAKYHLSIDVTNENTVLHLLECPFGFSLVPNYRLNWNGEHALPDYLKNHTVYTWP